jgi:uncharacterized protein (TIGR02271 family)
MTTANRSFVIAVFKDNNQAQQAIQDLLNAGFNRDQIRYSVRRGGGGIADDLTNMGISQREANFYNREFEQGHTVVTVHTNTQQQQAFNLLRKDGGYDFNTNQGQATNYAAPASGVGPATSVPIPNAPNTGNVATNAPAANVPGGLTGEREIELRTETLQPETRWVRAGEVDISKQVVSEQRTIDVPVTHEEVVIEHHPVSGQRQVSNTPIQANEDEVIRIPVNEEKVNVEKETVVTGDVTVGTRKVQETEHFTDTVRREELKVNREGDVDVENVNPQQNPQNPPNPQRKPPNP